VTPLLTLLDVHRHFGNRPILDGVSFTVNRGDRIGILGVNGAGKSTLMRVVVHGGLSHDPEEQPDAGEIRRARGLRLRYVPQEPRLRPEATVLELLREGQAGWVQSQAHLGAEGLDHEIHALHAEFDLPPLDARVGALSGGEARRVAIAAALLDHPDLLALDEPTNHLDVTAVEWLEQVLVTRVDALLLVTHDRRFLDNVATRILELDRGKIYATEGGYTRFLEAQAARLANEAGREEKRAAFVRRELEWVRRGPAAQTKKQQARVDRFEAAVEARPEPGQRAPDAGGPKLRIPPGPRLGKRVVETRKLGVDLGGRTLVRDLDLALKPGDRVGIVGPNGAGKTTLIRTLLGLRPPSRGEVLIGPNTVPVFLDQSRAELDDEKTVAEEVAEGNDWVQLPDEVVHVRSFLRGLLFDDRAAETRIGRLSGGERNRVLLARLLRRGGNLLVLDEPTNDLDLVTLTVLEDALQEFPGACLVVSHDRWFLDKVATALLVFEGEGRVVRYEGGWSDHERRGREVVRKARPTEAAPARVPEPAPAAPAATVEPAARRKLSYKEQRELAGMEDAILGAEAHLGALEAQVADPGIWKGLGPDGARALHAQLEAARAEVERLYQRWSELA